MRRGGQREEGKREEGKDDVDEELDEEVEEMEMRLNAHDASFDITSHEDDDAPALPAPAQTLESPDLSAFSVCICSYKHAKDLMRI